jgi:uncharacterized protein YqeY
MADTLKDTIRNDLNAARRERDKLRTMVLTTFISEIRNKEIDLGHELDDAEVHGVATTAIKRRREAAEQMRGGGREELAQKEEQEAAILQAYLPPQLGEDEVRAMVREAISAGAAVYIVRFLRYLPVSSLCFIAPARTGPRPSHAFACIAPLADPQPQGAGRVRGRARAAGRNVGSPEIRPAADRAGVRGGGVLAVPALLPRPALRSHRLAGGPPFVSSDRFCVEIVTQGKPAAGYRKSEPFQHRCGFLEVWIPVLATNAPP